MTCFHSFCAGCIKKHINNASAGCCPKCFLPFPSGSIKPVDRFTLLTSRMAEQLIDVTRRDCAKALAKANHKSTTGKMILPIESSSLSRDLHQSNIPNRVKPSNESSRLENNKDHCFRTGLLKENQPGTDTSSMMQFDNDQSPSAVNSERLRSVPKLGLDAATQTSAFRYVCVYKQYVELEPETTGNPVSTHHTITLPLSSADDPVSTVNVDDGPLVPFKFIGDPLSPLKATEDRVPPINSAANPELLFKSDDDPTSAIKSDDYPVPILNSADSPDPPINVNSDEDSGESPINSEASSWTEPIPDEPVEGVSVDDFVDETPSASDFDSDMLVVATPPRTSSFRFSSPTRSRNSRELVLFPTSHLRRNEEAIKLLKRMAVHFNANVLCEWEPKVTHLIMQTDMNGIMSGRTMNCLLCVAANIPIVSLAWVARCLQENRIVSEKEFLVVDSLTRTPLTAVGSEVTALPLKGFSVCSASSLRAVAARVKMLLQLAGATVFEDNADMKMDFSNNLRLCLYDDETETDKSFFSSLVKKDRILPVGSSWLYESIVHHRPVSFRGFIDDDLLTETVIRRIGIPPNLLVYEDEED